MHHSYKKEIEEQCPDITVTSISLLGQGWMNSAFLVNNEYVFRFANTKRADEELRTEKCILPKLRKRLSVQVPSFLYSGSQCDNGLAFVGYKLLNGKPLGPEVYNSLNRKEKNIILNQIADFLTTLHEFDKDFARQCGCKDFDYKKNALETIEHVKELVFPMVQEKVKKGLLNLFDEYITNDEFFNFKPVFIYADTKPDHLLFDETTKRIIGVIDWGNIRIGDPDHDLKHLYMSFGEEFIRELLVYYPHPDLELLMKKLSFFEKSDCVLGLLHGLKTKNEGLVKRYLNEVSNI